MKHLLVLLVLLGCLYNMPPLSATTIVPFEHLGAAARNSEAVVLAQAERPVEFRRGQVVYQTTRFRVVSTVKGPLENGQFFDLRPLSKQVGPYFAEVAGDFDPVPGQTYLLFMYRNDGVWRTQMLSYYVFEEKTYLGQSCLVPLGGQGGTEVMARPDGVVPEPLFVYQPTALLQALRHYADGSMPTWNPESAKANVPAGAFAEDRAIPSFCDFMLGSSTVLARWQNAAIDVYYDDTGLPGGFDATLNALLSNMVSNYTGISPFNGGLTSYVPDCSDNTPTNSGELFPFFNNNLNGTQSALIMFDDPCNELAALSGCSGTLAYGGSYRFGTTSNHVYKGDIWQDSGYGYLVVNDGVPACLSGTPLQLMLTHELTHAYRLDHISSTTNPGNNMNPLCCNAINMADRDCMNYAYDAALLPVTLRDFTVKAIDQQVLLSWKTESEHANHHFLLQRSADGLHFQTIATITAGNNVLGGRYEWIDKNPLPGLGYYRLVQVDLDDRQNQLGLRSIQMDGKGPLFTLAPNPVLPGMASTLQLQNAAPWEGTLEIIGAEGKVHYRESVYFEAGAHRIALPIRQLPGGVYRVCLRSKSGVEMLNLSKL